MRTDDAHTDAGQGVHGVRTHHVLLVSVPKPAERDAAPGVRAAGQRRHGPTCDRVDLCGRHNVVALLLPMAELSVCRASPREQSALLLEAFCHFGISFGLDWPMIGQLPGIRAVTQPQCGVQEQLLASRQQKLIQLLTLLATSVFWHSAAREQFSRAGSLLASNCS